MSEAATKPQVEASKPRRRSKPALSVMPPEEFFTHLIMGLLADGGVPGAFSNSSIEMMANPANAMKWYAGYICLCEGYQKVVTGEVKVNSKQFPPAIREKVAELIGSD